MMTSSHIIDVSEESFEIEVLGYSARAPVVIDFWAPWSISCRVQSPILAALALEGQGQFRLARVNVEEQPRLAERLKVTSVPSIKAFIDGRIVAEFTGVLPEDKLRGFVKRLIPDHGDLLLDKGCGLLSLGDPEGAKLALAEFLSQHTNHAGGLLAFARALLWTDSAKEALIILDNFPASREYNTAQELKPLALAMLWVDTQPTFQDEPLEAAYVNALRLARRGKLLTALDGLLDILRKDRNYRNGDVRQVYLGILHLLGEENEAVRQYRSDLSALLF